MGGGRGGGAAGTRVKRRRDSLVVAQAQEHRPHFLLNSLDRSQPLLVAHDLREARLYPLEAVIVVQKHLGY